MSRLQMGINSRGQSLGNFAHLLCESDAEQVPTLQRVAGSTDRNLFVQAEAEIRDDIIEGVEDWVIQDDLAAECGPDCG